MRIGGEIDAEEHHDQSGAEHAEDGNGDRGRPGGDTPLAHEVAEKLDQIDLLEDRRPVGEARKPRCKGHGAGSDALRELGGLLGERRSRRPHRERKTGRDGHRHDGEHQQARQAGERGKLAACAVEHDGEQDPGKGEEDRGLRVPQGESGRDDGERGGGDLRRPRGSHGSGRRRQGDWGVLSVAQGRLAGHGCLACKAALKGTLERARGDESPRQSTSKTAPKGRRYSLIPSKNSFTRAKNPADAGLVSGFEASSKAFNRSRCLRERFFGVSTST